MSSAEAVALLPSSYSPPLKTLFFLSYHHTNSLEFQKNLIGFASSTNSRDCFFIEPLATSFLSLHLIFIHIHGHGFTSHKPRMLMSQALAQSPSSKLRPREPFTWNLNMNMYKIMIGTISAHLQPVPSATFPSTMNGTTITQTRTMEQYLVTLLSLNLPYVTHYQYLQFHLLNTLNPPVHPGLPSWSFEKTHSLLVCAYTPCQVNPSSILLSQ